MIPVLQGEGPPGEGDRRQEAVLPLRRLQEQDGQSGQTSQGEQLQTVGPIILMSPQECCSKCGGSKWTKTGMMAERRGPKLASEQLSIRGNEEKFLGSTQGDAQLNV